MTKQYTVSRQIDAAPEVVWGLLSDATTWDDWNPAVISIKGPIRVGSKVELISIVNPKRTFKLKVNVLDAPSRMVWSDGMPFGLFKGERTYLCEANDGGTRFTMTEVYSGPLSGLISKSIPDMTDSFTQFADGLKTGAEAAGA